MARKPPPPLLPGTHGDTPGWDDGGFEKARDERARKEREAGKAVTPYSHMQYMFEKFGGADEEKDTPRDDFSFQYSSDIRPGVPYAFERDVLKAHKRHKEELDAIAKQHGRTPDDVRAVLNPEAVAEVTRPAPAETARPEAAALPDKAPGLYADRPRHPETGRRETIVQFLERVWRPWIESGALTRPDLRRLDPQADTALFNWERKPENTLPDHLRIPGKSEALREREAITSDDVRTARRILSRARRQKPAVAAKP